MRKRHKKAKIGVIVGGGTGEELAHIFIQTLRTIAQKFDRDVDIIKCEYRFKTYKEIRSLAVRNAREIVEKEIKILENFYREFYLEGGRAIFRTAINAEILYEFRRRHMVVKIIPILSRHILIIRDSTQGYYANDNYEVVNEQIIFEGSYKKKNLKAIIDYSIAEAQGIWNKPFEIWIVYKHHLFGGVLEQWIRDICPNAKIYQPNHATELLWSFFANPNDKNLLLIMGNEIADILHEELIFALNLGTRQTLFSKNVFLEEDLKGLKEYQTVHGSADDIRGKNLVNPIATLRIVADIAEHEMGIENFRAIMEEAISYARKNVLKPFTTEIVNCVQDYIVNIREKGGLIHEKLNSHNKRNATA